MQGMVCVSNQHSYTYTLRMHIDMKQDVDAYKDSSYRPAKTLCGTNEYIAPEILQGFPYGIRVRLGVLYVYVL